VAQLHQEREYTNWPAMFKNYYSVACALRGYRRDRSSYERIQDETYRPIATLVFEIVSSREVYQSGRPQDGL